MDTLTIPQNYTLSDEFNRGWRHPKRLRHLKKLQFQGTPKDSLNKLRYSFIHARPRNNTRFHRHTITRQMHPYSRKNPTIKHKTIGTPAYCNQAVHQSGGIFIAYHHFNKTT